MGVLATVDLPETSNHVCEYVCASGGIFWEKRKGFST